MPASSRFIDRLRKAARLERVKNALHRAMTWYWVTALTAAERDRAGKTPAQMTPRICSSAAD